MLVIVIIIIFFFVHDIDKCAVRTKKRIDNYQFDNWILKISLFHDIDEFDFLFKKKKKLSKVRDFLYFTLCW